MAIITLTLITSTTRLTISTTKRTQMMSGTPVSVLCKFTLTKLLPSRVQRLSMRKRSRESRIVSNPPSKSKELWSKCTLNITRRASLNKQLLLLILRKHIKLIRIDMPKRRPKLLRRKKLIWRRQLPN